MCLPHHDLHGSIRDLLLGVFVTVERRAAEQLAPLPILGRRGVAVTEIETYL